jgi:hypothetical protein
MASLKELTAQDLAEIIYQTIEDQPNINRKILIPAITAVVKAFAKVNNVYVVEKNEDKRVRAANEANAKCIYWQRLVKELDPDNIEKYYQDIANLEKQYRIK